MKLSKDEIQKIAQLARIELSDEEQKMLSGQLADVLEYVGKLQELGTDDVEITSQVTGLENIYREDEVVGCDKEKELLKQAPETEDGLIKSKAVF